MWRFPFFERKKNSASDLPICGIVKLGNPIYQLGLWKPENVFWFPKEQQIHKCTEFAQVPVLEYFIGTYQSFSAESCSLCNVHSAFILYLLNAMDFCPLLVWRMSKKYRNWKKFSEKYIYKKKLCKKMKWKYFENNMLT